MALKKDDLKAFIKKTNLIIAEVIDDSSEGTEIFKLVLAQPTGKVVGSNPTDQGQEMVLNQQTNVWVAGEDIEHFMNDTEKQGDGTLIYDGPMKLDVSKPNGRYVNNQFVMTKPPRLWLTKVAFNKRGRDLRSQRQTGLSQAVAQYFTSQGAAPVDPNVIESAKGLGNKQLEPVETGNGQGTGTGRKQ